MAVFLERKRFEGCGGLELTDEMRITIAAHACLLVVGREDDVFPTVRTILVYPHPYKGIQRERLGTVTIEREQARAGEAWGARGPLILAWDEVQRAGVVSERNVVSAVSRFGEKALSMPVTDILTLIIATVAPGDSIKRAMSLMTLHCVRQLVVIANGRLAGIVSVGDIVKRRLDDLETESNVLRDVYIAVH